MNYKIYYTKISLIDENKKEVAKITFPEISPNVYDIQKTFVDDSLRGQGIAGKLVQMAISEINKRGGEITASCSYYHLPYYVPIYAKENFKNLCSSDSPFVCRHKNTPSR